MEIAFLGHLSLDRNIVGGEVGYLAGGGVLHGGITARRLGAEVTVYTRCAPGDRSYFVELERAGVRVVFLPGETSTSIENKYPSDNPDERISRMISRAESFSADDLKEVKAEVLHINPLWRGEFPSELLAQVRQRVRFLGGDAQGFLRVVQPDGSMIHGEWPHKEQDLAHFDLLKVDRREAESLSGFSDIYEASRQLHRWGASQVLLTHSDGLCLYDGERFWEAPFGSYTLQGRTGRGDTCTASYLVARQTMPPDQAVSFAARITSLKMQYPGPFQGESSPPH